MRRRAWYALGLFLAVPAMLPGQGFGVYEHGTCTMGRAGTAAASPSSDGSAIFFNPAGIAGLTGTRISAGVTVIAASGSFQDDATGQSWDLDNPIIPVPNFYITHGFSSKLTAGIGVYAPYGLETRWGDAAAYDSVSGTFNTNAEAFPGRFLGWNSKLQSVYIQPTIGYQINPRLQVGIGVAEHEAAAGIVVRSVLNTPAPGAADHLRQDGLGPEQRNDRCQRVRSSIGLWTGTPNGARRSRMHLGCFIIPRRASQRYS